MWDREGLPTASEITSLCKHSFTVSSTCSLLACYHLQTLPFRLWAFGGISPLVQFICINSILSNATTLTVQRSHGTCSWESISNPWIFVGLQCWEGSIATWVTLGMCGCFLLRWLTGIWFCLNRSWTTSMTSWSLSSSSSPTSAWGGDSLTWWKTRPWLMLWRGLVSEIAYHRDSGLNWTGKAQVCSGWAPFAPMTFQELKVRDLQHRFDQSWQDSTAVLFRLLQGLKEAWQIPRVLSYQGH